MPPHGGYVCEVGPVWLLRTVYGKWFTWCSECGEHAEHESTLNKEQAINEARKHNREKRQCIQNMRKREK
jgi:hypothetical protein